MTRDVEAMRLALTEAALALETADVPIGAVVLDGDGGVIGRGHNVREALGDPTGHAELQAIRQASQRLGTPRLDGSVMYASGYPCPMCLAAMHMCGVSSGFFCYSLEDGQVFGLGTTALYQQMTKPPQQQSLPLRPLKLAGESGLYTEWLEVQQA